MSHALDAASLDQLFRTARTYNAFTGEVSDETLRRLYDLMKFGPTEANTTPARIVFVKSDEAKAKHEEALANARADKLLKEEEVWIRKGVEARRTRAVFRVQRLDRLRAERQARRERMGKVNLQLDSGDKSGKLVAELENVSKSYG